MTRFVAFISGKGGVGKTTTAINVGHALHEMGKTVVVVDANLETPHLGLYLGLANPKHHIHHFLAGTKMIQDTIHVHESGLRFIPGSSSISSIKTDQNQLVEVIEHLDRTADFVLLDCSSGFGPDIYHVLRHADESVIVTTPQIPAVTDALRALQLAKAHHSTIAAVVLNQINGKHGLDVKEVEEILGVPVFASIKTDDKVLKAAGMHAPVHYLYPHAQSSAQFRILAEHLTMERKV